MVGKRLLDLGERLGASISSPWSGRRWRLVAAVHRPTLSVRCPTVSGVQTDADISAARILALGLAGPIDRSPAEVVSHLVCLQAQALPGALCSVALRTPHRDLADVRRAIDGGEIVRSWTQRGTIHLVAARDVGWILDLTGDRMLRSAARRRAGLGIDDALIARAGDIVTALISAKGPVTRAALLGALESLGVAEVPGRGYHIIGELAMRQLIVHGPLTGESRIQQLFALSADWIADSPRYPREQALVELFVRYARGHGPVTVADAVRWTGLTGADARAGLSAGRESGRLGATDIDGTTYFLAAELPDLLAAHRSEARELLLLPGFDELILGYRDRSATLAPEHERLVVPGGNGMFRNTVVHRTRAVGTWTRSARAAAGPITVDPFPGRRVNRREVERAARRYPAFTVR
jgi:hypothetical protein